MQLHVFSMAFDYSQNFGQGQQNCSFQQTPQMSGQSGCPNFTNALSSGFFNHAGFQQQFSSIHPNPQWCGSSPTMPQGAPPTPTHCQTLDWAPALEKSGLQASIIPSQMGQNGGDAQFGSPMGMDAQSGGIKVLSVTPTGGMGYVYHIISCLQNPIGLLAF
ncbi:unnamed protein product [Allacma fusca]|uniref:Uncharacterized protein n=1 Tax=Allacma fusca TaxID=39272 RepID=A0A8J2JQ90_9HEXA|nr:unnamed protein product [Allacma fusca]